MDISGIWYNELGSKVELTVAPDGTVSGFYHTAVGDADGRYKLSGRTEVNSSNNDQNIGFVVSWENDSGNSRSVTAWSGQAQEVEGKQVMRTTWLLTRETNPSDDWASTLVSIDVFVREPPDAAGVARAKRLGTNAYPTRAT